MSRRAPRAPLRVARAPRNRVGEAFLAPAYPGPVTTSEKIPRSVTETNDASVFGDVEEKITRAIDEAVAERRREGLLLAVEHGRGVELIP